VIHVFKTESELLMAFANFFIEKTQNAIAKYGKCNVSLSGGNSPKKFYELLTSQNFRERVDWGKIFFFFGDERYVPLDDKRSNAFMVKNALFGPLNIAASQVFYIDTSLPPAEAAKKYAETITSHFEGQVSRFDLILLGLGDNAHTASLFPYSPLLTELSATVKSVFISEQNIYRITMTAPLINQARQIAFLIYGSSKAEAVKHVLKDARDIEKYPAQLICPRGGYLEWFLDTAAYLKVIAFEQREI
jgi:6-phosphogluconolactonase